MKDGLYTHKNWGGVFDIQGNTISTIIHHPVRWELMQYIGWNEDQQFHEDEEVWFVPWVEGMEHRKAPEFVCY